MLIIEKDFEIICLRTQIIVSLHRVRDEYIHCYSLG